jgi:hypothetical protein
MLTGQVVMEGFPVDTPPVPVTIEVKRTDGVLARRSPRVPQTWESFASWCRKGEMTFAVRDVPAGYQVKSFMYGDLDVLKNPPEAG